MTIGNLEVTIWRKTQFCILALFLIIPSCFTQTNYYTGNNDESSIRFQDNPTADINYFNNRQQNDQHSSVSDPFRSSSQSYQHPQDGNSDRFASATAVSGNPITDSNIHFGINMFKAITSSRRGNMVVSPPSVATLLAMLLQGSEGNTQKQLEAALALSKDYARQAYTDLTKLLQKGGSKVDISFANAMFIGHGFPLDPEFKSVALRKFHSDVELVDFKNSARAVNFINSWASKRTAGKIPALFDSSSRFSDDDCVLANAVFFKGIWKQAFSKSRSSPQPFFTHPGSEIQATLMHQMGNFRSGVDKAMGVKFLELPFEGDKFSMVLVLPSEQHGLDEAVAKMTPESLQNILTGGEVVQVTMGIPRFNISYDTSLQDILNKMGVYDIFTTQSQLTIGGPSRPLVVGRALQKATFGVDESGATAAAASALAVNTLSLAGYYDRVFFYVNQPFLAMIVEKSVNVPIFMARITNPTLEY